MKEAKKSKKIFLGAIAIVAMMTISAIPALSISNDSVQATNAHVIHAIDKPMPNAGTLTAGDVLISSDNPDGDDQHPSVAVNSEGTIAVTYEKAPSILQTTTPIVYSTDHGQTWTTKFEIDSTMISGSGVLVNPKIIYNSDTDEFFYSGTDPMAEYGDFQGWIQGDIASAEDIEYLIAWSSTQQVESASTHVGPWMVILNVDSGYNEQGLGLMYLYYDHDDQSYKWPSDMGYGAAGSYYDGQSITDTSPASNVEINAGSQRMYFVIEHENDSTGRSEIIYKETVTDLDPNSDTCLFTGGGGPGGMDKYADVEVWPWQGILVSNELHEYKDPDVATSGSNAVVVYQTNDNIYGDYDIHCTYTHDNGETWTTVPVIENHPADDTNPSVYMSGNMVYCVYVSSGNLYLIKSEDGGATWGTPEQVNSQDGTVVAEPRTAEVTAGGIVWTDNRNGHKDIYYAPLPMPVIGIPSISGGMGVKATVTNSGTEDASSVDWSIQLSGLIFVGKEATGTIDTLAAGSETTISTGLVFGIGPTTITVTAGGASKTASGFVLGPLVLGVK